MKYLVIALASIQGLWMLIDGIYVIANGKYMGPEKPGPWASVISLTGIDVFKLGPVFILFGLAWLVFVGAFLGERHLGASVRNCSFDIDTLVFAGRHADLDRRVRRLGHFC